MIPDHAVTSGRHLDLACPGCKQWVDQPAYVEHIRGCVAVQARPLVEAATRVSGSDSFHLDTFNDVVREAFDLPERKGKRWGRDVMSKLHYVTRFDYGFYRYEAR